MACYDYKTSSLEMFGVEELKPFQRNTIDSLMKGKDVYLSIKTGGGKSICYQAFQVFWTESHQKKCNVLVITPLISIMQEQCDFLAACGLKATYIGKAEDEVDDILSESFQFLYTSPEAVLSVPRWRDFINSSRKFQLIVIDEAHTVLRWGESQQSSDEPFRHWYGKIGEIRSLLSVPMLLITATANKAARTELKKKCVMQNCFEIVDNPDRENIKLFVKKVKSTELLGDLFYQIIKCLKEQREKCEKHLIFCKSIKTCGDVYSAFRLENAPEEFISMFHSKTIDSIKEKVKDDMQKDDGKIRVLIATSAAGMGVNYKNLNSVVHFGPAKDMDSFIQQIGRAGRNGEAATAFLLYNGRQLRELDADMTRYIKNYALCRREVMLSAYDSVPNKKRILHLCCDICAQKCACGAKVCKDDHFLNCNEEQNDSTDSDNACNTFCSDDSDF